MIVHKLEIQCVEDQNSANIITITEKNCVSLMRDNLSKAHQANSFSVKKMTKQL